MQITQQNSILSQTVHIYFEIWKNSDLFDFSSDQTDTGYTNIIRPQFYSKIWLPWSPRGLKNQYFFSLEISYLYPALVHAVNQISYMTRGILPIRKPFSDKNPSSSSNDEDDIWSDNSAKTNLRISFSTRFHFECIFIDFLDCKQIFDCSGPVLLNRTWLNLKNDSKPHRNIVEFWIEKKLFSHHYFRIFWSKIQTCHPI